MIPCELRIAVGIAAIQTQIAIAPEQRFVGQRWGLSIAVHNSALAGDDAVNVYRRLAAVKPGMTTAQMQYSLAMRPHDQLPGVQANRLLPANPLNGLARYIKPQHPRRAAVFFKRREHDKSRLAR